MVFVRTFANLLQANNALGNSEKLELVMVIRILADEQTLKENDGSYNDIVFSEKFLEFWVNLLETKGIAFTVHKNFCVERLSQKGFNLSKVYTCWQD